MAHHVYRHSALLNGGGDVKIGSEYCLPRNNFSSIVKEFTRVLLGCALEEFEQGRCTFVKLEERSFTAHT